MQVIDNANIFFRVGDESWKMSLREREKVRTMTILCWRISCYREGYIFAVMFHKMWGGEVRFGMDGEFGITEDTVISS